MTHHFFVFYWTCAVGFSEMTCCKKKKGQDLRELKKEVQMVSDAQCSLLLSWPTTLFQNEHQMTLEELQKKFDVTFEQVSHAGLPSSFPPLPSPPQSLPNPLPPLLLTCFPSSAGTQ